MYELQHGDSRNKRNAEDIWRIEIPDEVIERIKNLYHFEETGKNLYHFEETGKNLNHFEETGKKKDLSCEYGTRNEE